MTAPLGWLGIVRLGLVQAGLGAVVVLATSTMNRVMVIELALPAIVPGALVALHYLIQVLRPRMGYGSDMGGRRAPWIVGGMALLALAAVAASLAIAQMRAHPVLGVLAAIPCFAAIGLGVGAAGTSLLALLAASVAPARRPAAATIVWLMMIAGIAVTATLAGRHLEPFSPARLVEVTASVGAIAVALSALAVWRVEPRTAAAPAPQAARAPFRRALAQVWAEPQARRFTLFVFVSMLAYSAQELILDPFAGAVFGMTPGASTRLAGLQHGGVLAGMLLVAIGATALHRGSMRAWTIGGCIGSALMLASLAAAGFIGPDFPLRPAVFALGVANGTFAVSAIGAMMQLAGAGRQSREGTRMGLWGAAQAVAFGAGGLVGTSASDLARALLGSPVLSYAAVFAVEAILFLAASLLAARVFPAARTGDTLIPAAVTGRG